ncbi:MAG: hypothetical protein M1836_000239 [Candelina mexicana]|nr:MAG: hypothetical protein M1836_000239 [Candelina mexicana]
MQSISILTTLLATVVTLGMVGALPVPQDQNSLEQGAETTAGIVKGAAVGLVDTVTTDANALVGIVSGAVPKIGRVSSDHSVPGGSWANLIKQV